MGRALFNWIIQQNKASLTKSEITYAMRHRKLRGKERLTKALEILEFEHNILQTVIDQSTRKPTTNFLINPKLKNGK